MSCTYNFIFTYNQLNTVKRKQVKFNNKFHLTLTVQKCSLCNQTYKIEIFHILFVLSLKVQYILVCTSYMSSAQQSHAGGRHIEQLL